MKTLVFVLTSLLSAASAQANGYYPNAKLAGVTVHVRLAKDAATVTAVFEFQSLETRNAKTVYFPVFANDGDDPVQLLARVGLELEVNGQKTGIPAPCAAPAKLPKLPPGPRVCWFSTDIDALISDSAVEVDSRIIIRASYSQPLIRGRFYYLPVIVGVDDTDRKVRRWNYQMHVYPARATLSHAHLQRSPPPQIRHLRRRLRRRRSPRPSSDVRTL